MTAPANLIGVRFGRLVVVERAGTTRQGKALWRCRCDCGGETTTQTNYLRCGDTRSCGCLHSELAAEKGRTKKVDLTGRRFGRLIVVEEAQRSLSGDVRWRCLCDCGKESTPIASCLTRGTSLSCGCLRDELKRARAAAVGSMKRIRACRTCGRVYEATGPQKDCSPACRLRHHAADEAQRRDRLARLRMAQDAAALGDELERRLSHGEANNGTVTDTD